MFDRPERRTAPSVNRVSEAPGPGPIDHGHIADSIPSHTGDLNVSSAFTTIFICTRHGYVDVNGTRCLMSLKRNYRHRQCLLCQTDLSFKKARARVVAESRSRVSDFGCNTSWRWSSMCKRSRDGPDVDSSVVLEHVREMPPICMSARPTRIHRVSLCFVFSLRSQPVTHRPVDRRSSNPGPVHIQGHDSLCSTLLQGHFSTHHLEDGDG
ncbi:hypothetical protein EV363DRAFT_168909 [Boletus edulis]|nr:hypothetical protein EV363DRAFT_168909 [Boletus edulis]